MLIVVAGHSRGVGKTSLVEAIQRVTGRRFATLKISAHRHGGPGALPLVQTGAGWLLRARTDTFHESLPVIDGLLSSAPDWIVESNRLVAHRRPDLLLFVWHPETKDWKESADLCLAACDAVVVRGPDCPREIAGRRLPVGIRRLFQTAPGVLSVGSAAWLETQVENGERRRYNAGIGAGNGLPGLGQRLTSGLYGSRRSL